MGNRFTSFASFLLLQPSFTWTIHSDRVRVTALGTIFDGVALSKNVTFKAFNGLPGVTISNFQLPGDVDGGIEIETDAMIPSPARKLLAPESSRMLYNDIFQSLASTWVRRSLIRSLMAYSLVVSSNLARIFRAH
jgi:hypothetical protein